MQHTGRLKIGRIRPLWAIALIAGIVVISGAASAANKPKAATTDPASENIPIQITAEELVAYNEEKFAEFSGNVKAVQEDFVITSDKLRIYYRGELMNAEEKTGEGEMLKKIIATGNVKVKSDQYDAETEKLEYDTAAMTIVLTGENSKVINGKNSITGSKIIIYQKDNRVKVLGSKSKRIKAEFYSKDKGSDAFKMGPPKN